ncbi:MAG: tRNA dihydrouridine(20/20a) synthase DusA [Candidatus Obscuribacterales bacterium]|nr:tRNA dihydrouridine(20/20a) synthase DusA [Steroidobacteraceae bacterium]
MKPASSHPETTLDRRVCVAPMMDYTDRHFRFLLRCLSPGALLYTEMITTQALLRGDVARHLAFDKTEHPVALQLGGSEAGDLALAARLGADAGYDEINLNCGCPSDRVHSGRFGACLMAEPERVAAAVASMSAAVSVPVTVKCRIGIEPGQVGDDYENLRTFIDVVASAGCKVFILHARKAVLNGLSPKQNREIPPLRYDIVAQLRADFPQLTLVLNGGICNVAEVRAHLATFDGVMLGREICQNPYLLAELHQAIYAPEWELPTRESVVDRYASYVDVRLAEGHRLASMLRHALPLYASRPGGRAWRRYLSERASMSTSTSDLLRQALRLTVGQAA